MRTGHYQKIDKYDEIYLLVDRLLNGWVRNLTDIYIKMVVTVGDYKYDQKQYVLVTCLCYLLIQLGQDERMRLALRASPSPHYNPIHSACHLNQQHTFTASTHMQVIRKPCGDGRAAKQQVRKY